MGDGSETDHEPVAEIVVEPPGTKPGELTRVADPPEVGEILQDPDLLNLVKGLQAKGVAVRIKSEFSWSGPLPPSSELGAYDRLVPGSAKRMMDWAEEEGKHRRDMERVVIPGNSKRADRGQILGFVLALATLALAAALMFTGFSAWGVAIVIAEIAGLAGVFVFGRLRARGPITAPPDEEDGE